ncbi:MAG: hypothetical protein M5U34_33150 [Chloroflexi bacterium]|nr:hypothetical protein [Chloroflexota bacterium]
MTPPSGLGCPIVTQNLSHIRRPAADQPVTLFFQVAQLQHIPQDCHATAV